MALCCTNNRRTARYKLICKISWYLDCQWRGNESDDHIIGPSQSEFMFARLWQNRQRVA